MTGSGRLPRSWARRLVLSLLAGALAAPALAAPPPPPPPPPPAQARVVQQAPSGGPARIDANLQMLSAEQQPAMQNCLFEGARLAGARGATTFKLTGIESIEQGNGGWRFTFGTLKSNAGGQLAGSAFCRATATRVIEYTTR